MEKAAIAAMEPMALTAHMAMAAVMQTTHMDMDITTIKEIKELKDVY